MLETATHCPASVADCNQMEVVNREVPKEVPMRGDTSENDLYVFDFVRRVLVYAVANDVWRAALCFRNP